MNNLKINLFITIFLMTAGPQLNANETESLKDQISQCKSNASMRWDASLNRCVYNKEDVDFKAKGESCNKIEDAKQKEACFLKLAEEKSDVQSDPDAAKAGGLGVGTAIHAGSALVAYNVIGKLNTMVSKDSGLQAPDGQDVDTTKVETKADSSGKSKKCMSKTILGITGLAGIATDLWMKKQAKDEMDDLKNGYSKEVETTTYEAQKTAFDYLKKEQEAVKKIAGLEKKRNLALMAGYGAALGFAAYEQFINKTPGCSSYSSDPTAGN